MAFDITGKLPLYAGIALTIRLTNPGSATRVNGGADDAFVDTASNFQFVATVAEDLVGTFDYVVFSGSQPVEVGTVYRANGQATVLLGSVAPGSSGSSPGSSYVYPPVERNVSNETPILFTWPSASATITVTRSIDAGSYAAATGGATFAYTQDGQHFYSLAYSANDRPAGAGSVVYRLNDGTVVRLLPLQVEATSAEEVVDELENRGITTVAVQSGVTNATTLELIQGDTYDGTGKPLLGFVVTKDYTSGWTATLTIRDEDDAVISTTTGVVASATSITFSLTAPTGLPMSGCPGSFKGKFDVQMSNGSSRDTVTRGACYVYEDQTRT
jgi:hypothetical protein